MGSVLSRFSSCFAQNAEPAAATGSTTHLPKPKHRSILSHLTSREKINARKVHSLTLIIASEPSYYENWIAGELAPRRSMQLLLNENGKPMFPAIRHTAWNTLKLKSLDEITVQQIVATFTRVSELQVCCFSLFGEMPESLFDFLVNLLEHWQHKLVSFKLLEHFKAVSASTADRLFVAINSLSSLKHLTLNLHHLSPLDLSILGQLKEIKYVVDAAPDQFIEMLQRHGLANAALRIEYGFKGDNADQLKQFFLLSKQLRDRFAQFHLPGTRLIQRAFICSQFRFLSSLSLEPSAITFRYLFGHLAKLTQLIHLHLRVNFQFIIADIKPHVPLPQVMSIKALELTLFMRSHGDLLSMDIAMTMPKVEVIEFRFHALCQCTDCGLTSFYPHYLQAKPKKARRCLYQIFSPLKRDCATLHSILHNREEVLGSAKKLLDL